MSKPSDVRFVATEIAYTQVSNGVLSYMEMVDMAEAIIEHHELEVTPEDYDWIEGLVMQYTHELKPQWRAAR